MAKEFVKGQKSWRVAVKGAEAWVTELGGHLGPVIFEVGGKKIEPLSVAPWAEESPTELERRLPPLPNIIKVLRGDFFGMPFGGNARAYRGEKYEVHGETANERWRLETYSIATHAGPQPAEHATPLGPKEAMLHCSLETKARKGRVDKHVILRERERVVYQKHVVRGMKGAMNFGHHAMVKFPADEGSGLVSTSRMKLRQVWLEPTERPEMRGYSALKPGAEFHDLERVPTVFGGSGSGAAADLSRFPARRGYEDIVINVNDPRDRLGWTCIVFPKQRYVWFSLKDPRVLASTLFWISNGGRHYAPWNGRHVNVMGIEEVTSFFHVGLAESAAKNSLSRRGIKTAVELSPKKPLVVNYIFGVAPLPAGFDHVRTLEPVDEGLVLVSRSGKKAFAACDIGFLASGA